MSLWLKRPDLTPGNYQKVRIGGLDRFELPYTGSTTDMLVGFFGSPVTVPFNQSRPLTEWNHFAVIRSSSNVKVLQNGYIIYDGAPGDAFDYTRTWFIDANFRGRIDDLRIYRTALPVESARALARQYVSVTVNGVAAQPTAQDVDSLVVQLPAGLPSLATAPVRVQSRLFQTPELRTDQGATVTLVPNGTRPRPCTTTPPAFGIRA